MITLGSSFEKLVEEVREIGPSVTKGICEESVKLLNILKSKMPNATAEQLLIIAEIKVNISKLQFQVEHRSKDAS
jgi:hypothetical protein